MLCSYNGLCPKSSASNTSPLCYLFQKLPSTFICFNTISKARFFTIVFILFICARARARACVCEWNRPALPMFIILFIIDIIISSFLTNRSLVKDKDQVCTSLGPSSFLPEEERTGRESIPYILNLYSFRDIDLFRQNTALIAVWRSGTIAA